jgi:hypothetical protein
MTKPVCEDEIVIDGVVFRCDRVKGHRAPKSRGAWHRTEREIDGVSVMVHWGVRLGAAKGEAT